eukprot:scaffold2644_cov33-Tisochrysis_lutea.AAC.2
MQASMKKYCDPMMLRSLADAPHRAASLQLVDGSGAPHRECPCSLFAFVVMEMPSLGASSPRSCGVVL